MWQLCEMLAMFTWRYLQHHLPSADGRHEALRGAGAAAGEVEVPQGDLAHVGGVDHVPQPVPELQSRLLHS